MSTYERYQMIEGRIIGDGFGTRTRTGLFVVLVCMLSAATSDAALKTLAEYRAIYERKLNEINEAHSKAGKSALAAYGRDLETIKEHFRKKGDLEGITAMKDEMTRFAKERTVPQESEVKEPELLLRARIAYRKSVADTRIARDRRTVALVRQYLRPLDALKKELVRQEKLARARDVADEMKKVEFVLSEAEMRLRTSASGTAGSGGMRRLPAVLRAGLVLYYSFDSRDGKTVKDGSGKGADGELHGATWTGKGVVGGAYEFDGRDDHIVSDGHPGLAGTAHSIVAWVNSKPSQQWQGIAGYWLQPSARAGYGLVIGSDGRFGLMEADGTKWAYAFADTVLRGDNEWHHVAGVRDGKRASLYIDGVLQKGTTDLKPTFGAGFRFIVGGGGKQGQFFHGTVDEVMVYSRALTRTEIVKLRELRKTR